MNGVHESMRARVDAVAASMGDGGPDQSEKAPAGAATLAQAPSRRHWTVRGKLDWNGARR